MVVLKISKDFKGIIWRFSSLLKAASSRMLTEDFGILKQLWVSQKRKKHFTGVTLKGVSTHLAKFKAK